MPIGIFAWGQRLIRLFTRFIRREGKHSHTPMGNTPRHKHIDSKPAGKDLFQGQSHERLACNIANYLRQKSHSRIIGLEGDWGSGKSNVIELLRKKLEATHYVYIYDAWGHQEDSQRRSFLEELTEELTAKEILPKDPWNKKTEELLARRKTTESKTIPKMSWGVWGLIIITVLTPILTQIASLITNEWHRIILVSAPLAIGLTIYLGYCIIHGRWPKPGEVLHIYQGEATEKTTHESISDYTPSTKKFTGWMQDVSDALGERVPLRELLVVYDNMDRLPPADIKELWSSIHTFFAEREYEHITVIVPFDKRHLSLAFSIGKTHLDGTKNHIKSEGYREINAFLRKTFATIYRVTPPVLSDWKGFFNDKFYEAFGEYEAEELPVVRSIFNSAYAHFTPRDIITFINELVTLQEQWGDAIPLRYLAFFTAYKDEILENPLGYLLDDNTMTEAARLQLHEDFHDYQAAIVYNVPPILASQVLLRRNLELLLQGESSHDAKLLVRHPNFVEVLETVIAETPLLDIATACEQLAKAMEVLPQEKVAQMEHIWSCLASQQLLLKIDKPEYKNGYSHMLKYAPLHSKNELAEYLIEGYQQAMETSQTYLDGSSYYNSLTQLEKDITECGSSVKVADRLREVEVSAPTFFNYLIAAGEDNDRYKLYTSEEALDGYLAGYNQGQIVDLPNPEALAYLKPTYKLPKTLKRTEIYLKEAELTKENFNQYITLYKALSTEHPLEPPIPQHMLDRLVHKITPGEPGYHDLIAMAIAYGYYRSFSQWNTVAKNCENDETVASIASIIEDYTTLGELLMRLKDTDTPLLRRICKRLIEDDANEHQLAATELLKNFTPITKNLSIAPEDFLAFLSHWIDDTREHITLSNLEEVIADSGFYKTAMGSGNPLADHLNSLAIEFLKSQPEERWRREYGENNSYIYGVLSNYLHNEQMPPPTLRKALKSMLKQIAIDEIPVPREESFLRKLFREAQGEDWTATLKDILDSYYTKDYISPEQFLFFEPMFRQWGDTAESADRFARRILDRVIQSAKCLALILGNAPFYASIIVAASTDATDLKEKIREMAMKSDDEGLRIFARDIGIDLSKETGE
ncbi:MAG: hypothetical protein CSA97_03580 [Bacteroidetes bacterium]|nr:MAG: hypothetical protein CSA97_03580 [Bacteroidota bacterium]